MKEDLGHPGEVELTGHCHRVQELAPWKRHWNNALVIGLTLTTIGIGFEQLILLIMRRGP